MALAILVAVALGAARAEAVTVRDVIELSKSGVAEEVLLALVDIEPQVFPVDPATVKALKDGGVSERVIAAMVRHGRTRPIESADAAPVPDSQPAPEPEVVVIDHRDDREPVVREVPVAVPVYVPVFVHPSRHHAVRVVSPVPVDVLAPSIGLVHSRLGLSPAPAKPTSDPPYWQQYAPLPRRSDPPYWKRSPYLK